MACFAAALYGWFERRPDGACALNLVILALALAGGLWTHYFFVLAFIPIVLGEAVRQAAQRRVDIRPWTAIVLAGVIALPLWPLVRASSAQRATFWARPDADSPLVTRTKALYRSLFETLEQPGARNRRAGRRGPARGRTRSSRTLGRVAEGGGARTGRAGGAPLLPVAGLLLGDYSASLPSAMCSSRLSASCWRWTRPVVACAAQRAGEDRRSRRRDRSRRPPRPAHPLGSRTPLNQLERRPVLVDRLERFPDPVVITGGVDTRNWYDMPATVRPRALYLVDPDAELARDRAYSILCGFSALARWTPLPVVPIDEFVASHPGFWMYSLGPNWIERSLTRRGATLIEHARDRQMRGRWTKSG